MQGTRTNHRRFELLEQYLHINFRLDSLHAGEIVNRVHQLTQRRHRPGSVQGPRAKLVLVDFSTGKIIAPVLRQPPDGSAKRPAQTETAAHPQPDARFRFRPHKGLDIHNV